MQQDLGVGLEGLEALVGDHQGDFLVGVDLLVGDTLIPEDPHTLGQETAVEDTTPVTMAGAAALEGLAWVWVVACCLATLWGG